MKNRFESRKTLNLQIGGPNGTGNVNPLQPKSEIKEAPSAAGIRSINDVMAGIGPMTQSVEISRAAGEFAQA
jgi:hypothetical protein